MKAAIVIMLCAGLAFVCIAAAFSNDFVGLGGLIFTALGLHALALRAER